MDQPTIHCSFHSKIDCFEVECQREHLGLSKRRPRPKPDAIPTVVFRPVTVELPLQKRRGAYEICEKPG